jgi:hypothetical protein
VYSDDLLRQLCGDILNQKDSHKTEELISLLQAVIKDDQEDVRVRMAFLAKTMRPDRRVEGHRLDTRPFVPSKSSS